MSGIKQILRSKLSTQELSHVRKAFDIIGDIALLEIPSQLTKKQKIIANAVLQLNPHLKAVYKEASARSGKLRLQKLVWLAGEKRTNTMCKENGIILKLDIATAFYSPRQATERKRILTQIKRNQTVLVMFSGVGPFAVQIAKFTKAKSVLGIEINKKAHMFALQNAILNKVEHKLSFICGDVTRIMPSINLKFDHIFMPLPKGALAYLPVAFKFSKKGTIIHYYDYLPEESIPIVAKKRVKNLATQEGKKIRILRVVKCGQLAVRQYRICTEFKVIN